MTVYVGDMRAKYGRLILCHMVADTDAELHAMAARIGVARRRRTGELGAPADAQAWFAAQRPNPLRPG